MTRAEKWIAGAILTVAALGILYAQYRPYILIWWWQTFYR